MTELQDQPSRSIATPARESDRGPAPWVPMTLVVLATVLAVTSVFTTWVRTQALDTDQWVAASSELLAEPEIQEALATYLTGELFSTVDVTDQLADALPEPLSPLAGPLTAALRPPATAAVERLVASPRFAQAWARANRVAHETLVTLLRGESGPVASTAGGAITLDLGEAVVLIGQDLGVPQAALDRIPPDAGQVVLFQSDRLAQAQQTVRVLDTLSWFLFLLVAALYGAAVWLSPGRRRRTVRLVGVSLVVGGIVVLLGREIGLRTAVDLFVSDAANRGLADLTGEVATRLLRQLGWSGIVYGLLFVGFAWLLGDHRWAVGARRWLGRWSESTPIIVTAAVIVFLALVWLSPGGALDRWASILVLGVVTVAATVALASRVREEADTTAPRSPPGPSRAEPSP